MCCLSSLFPAAMTDFFIDFLYYLFVIFDGFYFRSFDIVESF